MARKDAATTKGTAKAPVKAKSAKAPAKAPAKALAKGPVKATSEKAKSTVTFGSAMPCLNCADVEAEVKFLVEGLGFQKHMRFDGPDGTLMHGEYSRDTGMVMLGPAPVKGKPHAGLKMDLGAASIYVIVDSDGEVDAVYATAMKCPGVTSASSPENKQWGGRSATVKDAEGHYWSIGSYRPQ